MQSIHYHYDQLTEDERHWVDELFREIFSDNKINRSIGMFAPALAGDDSSERAVDGIARWIIESRTIDAATDRIDQMAIDAEKIMDNTCAVCGDAYRPGGDGFAGCCPSCADQVSALMDEHKIDDEEAIDMLKERRDEVADDSIKGKIGDA